MFSSFASVQRKIKNCQLLLKKVKFNILKKFEQIIYGIEEGISFSCCHTIAYVRMNSRSEKNINYVRMNSRSEKNINYVRMNSRSETNVNYVRMNSRSETNVNYVRMNSRSETTAITTQFDQQQYDLNKKKQKMRYRNRKFLSKREAKPHSAPFIVSIQMLTPTGELVHYCAGTIINENWILTAAHCFKTPELISQSVIVAGCHELNAECGADEEQCKQFRHIDYYVKHHLYLGGINPYDIALIYVKEPFIFNEYVAPAVLPTQDDLPKGYGKLYGWGNVSMTTMPTFPKKLQQSDMPILRNSLGEQILSYAGRTLHETNLCTGPLTGGNSICNADSGGPLVQRTKANCCFVIGIVSWGKMPCGQMNTPSVFVRVSAFTNWIQQIITTKQFD